MSAEGRAQRNCFVQEAFDSRAEKVEVARKLWADADFLAKMALTMSPEHLDEAENTLQVLTGLYDRSTLALGNLRRAIQRRREEVASSVPPVDEPVGVLAWGRYGLVRAPRQESGSK